MKKSQDHPSPRRKITPLTSVKALTASALLAAASFVLAFIAKSIFGTGFIRITFECLLFRHIIEAQKKSRKKRQRQPHSLLCKQQTNDYKRS